MGCPLKDRKRSEDLCNLLGINCVAECGEAWKIEMVWTSGSVRVWMIGCLLAEGW